MATQVSLMEAASFLGVSRATLRNWDKDGKLSAVRNPVNGYRMYNMDELIAIRNMMLDSDASEGKPILPTVDSKSIKRTISKLHNIIRDGDASSNIITRFDEISKLLFLKLYAEHNNDSLFMHQMLESDEAYLLRLQNAYETAIKEAGIAVPDVFMTIHLAPEVAAKCGIELDKVDFSNAGLDVKGLAYEDTIKGTFDKSDNQQYFTPYQVVDFMVQMSIPFIRGVVCDPACGTAGFLNKVGELCPEVSLLGLEVDDRLAWVSNLNLLIHGNDDFKVMSLANGGSLGPESHPYFGSADVIITNPPFGSDYSDSVILSNFALGRNHSSRRRGILFLEQAWNLLRDGGFVAIIIDQGVLNASSNLDVRNFLLSHFNLLAIVDLPDTAFMPYANVSSSILFMQKTLHSVPQTNVFFGRSLCVGRKTNGDDDVIYSEDGSTMLNSDLPFILSQWQLHCNGHSNLQGECFSANITENLDGDESLRLDYVYHHPYRKESQKLLEQSPYRLMSLAEICDEKNETYIPSADSEATTIQFTGLANIESYTGKVTRVITPAASIKSAVKKYDPQDIVFSKMRPSLRKTAVMQFEDGGYVSSECSVFSVRRDADGKPIIDPELLCALLRSDFIYGQIMSRVTGIGRPRIGNKDLRNIKIPVPPRVIQDSALLSMNTSLESAAQLREKAALLMSEAQILEKKAVNNAAKKMSGE